MRAYDSSFGTDPRKSRITAKPEVSVLSPPRSLTFPYNPSQSCIRFTEHIVMPGGALCGSNVFL